MAVLQNVNFLSNERLDLPDLKNIETFVSEDIRQIFEKLINNKARSLVITGFQIYQDEDTLNDNPSASPVYVKVEDSVMLHTLRSLGSTFFVGPVDEEPIQVTLNPGATNYLELELSETTGAADTRAFWDPEANSGQGLEFTQIVDTATFLTSNVSVNTVSFTGGDKVPLAEIVVDGAGSVVSLTDRRNMLFRLGIGFPYNKDYDYAWDSRSEPNPDRKVDSLAFTGGDKQIDDLYSWMQAVMTSIKEVQGSPFWFSGGTSSITNLNLLNLFFDAVGSVITGTGTWEHNASFAGKLTWSSDVYLRSTISDLYYKIPTGSADLADGQVAYIDLIRYIDLSTVNYAFTNGNTSVTAPSGGFSSLVVGDWIKAKSDNFATWRRIESFNTGNPVTATAIVLDKNYSGSTISESAVYCQGEYSVVVSDPESIPADANIYWVAKRDDGGDVLPKLFLRGMAELEQGEERQINDNSTEEILQFIGSPSEKTSTPPYTQVPDPSLPFQYSTSDSLTKAVSTNAGNINSIVEQLQKPYYEPMDVITIPPTTDNEIQGPVISGALITLPKDSRDADVQKYYLVGNGALMVFLNGQHLRYGIDYDEVGTFNTLSTQIEILQDLPVGDALEFRMLTPELFGGPTPIAPQPYFVNYLDGQTIQNINVGDLYNLGTNKLDVYRNGRQLFNNGSLGLPVDRYLELTTSTIELGQIAVASDLFSFINEDVDPAFKVIRTGISGVTLAVPEYDMGTGKLRVYRNGILMSTSGSGGLITKYTEATSTTITLEVAATPSDIFIIQEMGVDPSFREEVTGATGFTINLINSYTMGDEKLLVYRNGVLLLNSLTLGDQIDRYQELSTTSVQLEVTAVATDVFTFIRKA